MKMGRPGPTQAQQDEVWRVRPEGLSEAAIARRTGLTRRQVNHVMNKSGGIPPRRARERAERCLSLPEREEISRGVAREESDRKIGRRLGRHHTTIGREIARCGGRGRYRAHLADERAWQRARRPKQGKLDLCPELARLVAERLEEDHSPQQISGWLKLTYPDNEAMQVSHETIYRALYVQARGALKRELTRHLRRGRSRRYARSQS